MANKLWHTGVDDHGLLPPGKKDPNWTVVSGPTIGQSHPAFVLNDQTAGGLYFQTTDSQWIGVEASGNALAVVPMAIPYIFQTTFDVGPESDQWIQINGIWCADNYGQFTLDGMPLLPGCDTGETVLFAGMVGTNFSQPHAFSISEMHMFSASRLQLQAGPHTLEVLLYQEGQNPGPNPCGFNMSADIAVHPVHRVRQIAIHR